MKKLLVILAAVLALTGCSSINSGVVTSKHYEPPYSYITMQCHGYDAKGNCTVNMPVTHYMPERFRLNLMERSDKPRDQRETGWVYVGELTYENYSVGDYYEGEE